MFTVLGFLNPMAEVAQYCKVYSKEEPTGTVLHECISDATVWDARLNLQLFEPKVVSKVGWKLDVYHIVVPIGCYQTKEIVPCNSTYLLAKTVARSMYKRLLGNYR